MRHLTITVASTEEFFDRAQAAARRIDAGGGYQGEVSSFETAELLFNLFTPKRWELLNRLRSLGHSSLRQLARSLGRDVKRVHEDVAKLLEEGIIERDEEGKLFVPFDRIHVDLDILKKTSAA